MAVALTAVVYTETVPCTERSHFVVPQLIELIAAKRSGRNIKKKATIVEESSVLALRAEIIGKKIIKALNRNLQMKKSKTSSTSHLNDLDWKVVVISTEEGGINAKCIADGTIFIFLKVMDYPEDFIASVIAHEVNFIFYFLFFSLLKFMFD